MSALIQLTLDGSLVIEQHKVSVRILSGALTNIQRVADRAYLDVHHGSVRKYARLTEAAQSNADFVVGNPEAGSYIIKLTSDLGGEIVRRIKEAISQPFEKALDQAGAEIDRVANQIAVRRAAIENGAVAVQSYGDFLANPPAEFERGYSEKAINNYVSQLLNPVAGNDGAVLRLDLKASSLDPVSTYEFDSQIAKAFRKEIGRRSLGPPVLYSGHLRMLDRGHKRSNFKGKFTNSENDKDHMLFIKTEEDYDALSPYINSGVFEIVACPVIEYGSHDAASGDIQFIKLAVGE